MKPKIIAVIGTTASGKSSLGIEIARDFCGEIISADSRQVYKGLDLGTGKVTTEERLIVPHHLLDVVLPNQPFSLYEFQRLAYAAIDDVLSRKKLPVLVGGTGLYSRAVTDGYNLSEGESPDQTLRDKLNAMPLDELWKMLSELGEEEPAERFNKRRVVRQIEKLLAGDKEQSASVPRYDVLKLGIIYPRDVLRRRIGERLDIRIADGMIEEIKTLKENGATDFFLEGLGLEYRYTNRYLNGTYPDFQTYRDELFTKICQFAKRQETWYKKEQNAIWLDPNGDMLASAEEEVKRFLNV